MMFEFCESDGEGNGVSKSLKKKVSEEIIINLPVKCKGHMIIHKIKIKQVLAPIPWIKRSVKISRNYAHNDAKNLIESKSHS